MAINAFLALCISACNTSMPESQLRDYEIVLTDGSKIIIKNSSCNAWRMDGGVNRTPALNVTCDDINYQEIFNGIAIQLRVIE